MDKHDEDIMIKTVLENEIEEQEKAFFKRQIGYEHAYSDVTIVNATKEEVLAVAKEYIKKGNPYYADFGSVWMDGRITPENGIISFVGYRENPQKLAKFFSTYLPEAIVYTDTGWDYHAFYCYKNGEECHEYTAGWLENEPGPYIDEDSNGEPAEYYGCEVVIMDHLTGHIMTTGGGACTEDEYKAYCKMIEEHPPVALAKNKGR